MTPNNLGSHWPSYPEHRLFFPDIFPDKTMSHDRNFKNLILDYPHQAPVFFATAEADGIDAARITPVRQEQQ